MSLLVLLAGTYILGAHVSKTHGLPLLPDFSNCTIVPHVCPNDNISYWLYTRSTQDNPYLLNVRDDDNLRNAPYTQGAPALVIIHGYTGYRDYSPNMELRPAYFKKGDYNIISLDYGPLARSPCYVQAAQNVETIGNCTVQLLLKLMNLVPSVYNLDNLRVIGFSLGSQVAGSIGKNMRAKKNALHRITGLDPALPLFDGWTTTPSQRLDPTDALFVDVVHSNTGNKGTYGPTGTVDFYMNKATDQPGCQGNASCDHVRAVEYFAESINTNVGFYGVPCNLGTVQATIFSTAYCTPEKNENYTELMGEYVSLKARGTFMVHAGGLRGRRRRRRRRSTKTSYSLDKVNNVLARAIEALFLGMVFISPAILYGSEGIRPPLPNPETGE